MARATDNNENTTKSFLKTLQDSFITYEINNFRFSVKPNTKAKNKTYSIDNGLIMAVKYNFSNNKGKMLENAVFTEIIKSRKYKVFFFNDKNECDYILKSKTELTAIQVVYELNPNNKRCEIAGLLKVKKQFNINKLIIVTYKKSEKIENIDTMTFVDFCFFLEELK